MLRTEQLSLHIILFPIRRDWSLDFKNVRSQLTSQTLQNQYVGNIRCYELLHGQSSEPGARIVFELKAHMKFAVRVHNSGLVLEMTTIEPPPQQTYTQTEQPPTVPDTSNTQVQQETLPERQDVTTEETNPAETSPSQPDQQSNQITKPIEKPQAQAEQPAQQQATPNIPPVSQPKTVVRIPGGGLDLEPTDADPALFFTVPANSTDYVLGSGRCDRTQSSADE